jgi:hypothetical protein
LTIEESALIAAYWWRKRGDHAPLTTWNLKGLVHTKVVRRMIAISLTLRWIKYLIFGVSREDFVRAQAVLLLKNDWTACSNRTARVHEAANQRKRRLPHESYCQENANRRNRSILAVGIFAATRAASLFRQAVQRVPPQPRGEFETFDHPS